MSAVRDEPSPFAGAGDIAQHLSKKERRIQEEHDILMGVARDDTLDIFEIVDKDFNASFDNLDFLQRNPGATEAYKQAVTYLRRLFIQREQIAILTRQPNTASLDFMFVLNRLLDDL